MKTIKLIFFVVFVITLFIFSCTKEAPKAEIDGDRAVELRSSGPETWCDEGSSSSPPLISIDIVTQGSNGECCVQFLTCSNKKIRFHTTDYNFINGTGSSTGTDTPLMSDGNGNFTHCWVNTGSHYLIEFECGGQTQCVVFKTLNVLKTIYFLNFEIKGNLPLIS